jgi:hypothetical protein
MSRDFAKCPASAWPTFEAMINHDFLCFSAPPSGTKNSEAVLGYSARSRGLGLESWWRGRLLAAAWCHVRARALAWAAAHCMHGPIRQEAVHAAWRRVRGSTEGRRCAESHCAWAASLGVKGMPDCPGQRRLIRISVSVFDAMGISVGEFWTNVRRASVSRSSLPSRFNGRMAQGQFV